MTELGRQPWIVFGLMKTEAGVSTAVAASSVLLTLVLFTAVYGALMVVTIYLLRKYAKTDPLKDALPVSAY
jgi:cytochrome d ubiquinol oxidase subunit I